MEKRINCETRSLRRDPIAIIGETPLMNEAGTVVDLVSNKISVVGDPIQLKRSRKHVEFETGTMADLIIKYEPGDDVCGELEEETLDKIIRVRNEAASLDTAIKTEVDSDSDTDFFPIETDVQKKVDYADTVSDLDKYRNNVKVIMTSSNATPIRHFIDTGYKCCFCETLHPTPADLKTHTLGSHNDEELDKYSPPVLKLDITGLLCKICNAEIDQLEKLIEHLTSEHEKLFYKDIRNKMVPFKFDTEVMHCVVCEKEFTSFQALTRHMNNHYSNYVCSYCGVGFVNKGALKTHSERHTVGDFSCDYCPKVFKNKVAKKQHERNAHISDGLNSRCWHCGERFPDHKKKLEHLLEVHGIQPEVVKCHKCHKTFAGKNKLTDHMKYFHMRVKRIYCTECGKGFYQKSGLERHMVKHTKERKFQCAVCAKFFVSKGVMTTHMKIHLRSEENEKKCRVRNFGCPICHRLFLTEATLTVHMKNHSIDDDKVRVRKWLSDQSAPANETT